MEYVTWRGKKAYTRVWIPEGTMSEGCLKYGHLIPCQFLRTDRLLQWLASSRAFAPIPYGLTMGQRGFDECFILLHLQFFHQMHRPVSQSFFDLRNEDLDFLRSPVLDPNQQAKECGLQELLQIYSENTTNLFLATCQHRAKTARIGHTDQLLVPRPSSYWDLAYVVVYIDEASFFNPALEMLAWRPVPPDLVAGCSEHTAELNDLVVVFRSFIFTVRQRIEVLQFDPATWNEVPDQSASRIVRKRTQGPQLTRRTVAEASASLVCFQAYNGCE